MKHLIKALAFSVLPAAALSGPADMPPPLPPPRSAAALPVTVKQAAFNVTSTAAGPDASSRAAPAAQPINVVMPPLPSGAVIGGSNGNVNGPSVGQGKGRGTSRKVAQDRDLAMEEFFGASPTLTVRERAALAIAKRWQDGSSPTASMPTADRDGMIRFPFGASQPSVVCAVLQVCDVELQSGEQVNSINLGDTARWLVEPAISGAGASEVQHLMIKPQDVGLTTSLVVTTNRRTYHFLLRSHLTEFMPRIAFSYPEEVNAKWEALRNREVKERREATMPQTGEYLGDLSFDYTVSGEARWKPLRVYNDGRKTVIQMSGAIAQTEAPSLLLVRKDGGVFTEEETALVNYRVQGDRYIVDSVFDKAILIAGVGPSQDRVTIQRGK
jgi:P-type conjugative transfer protein TrbG